MTTKKTIFSKAPTRIDLAGGTVDLWPLYLFLRDPMTINLGIDLFAEAKLEETDAEGIILRSEDQNAELKLGWDALANEIKVQPQLELHYKLLRHFARERAQGKGKSPSGGLKLSTKAGSPAGAGLGGSSTLSIAMIGALATWSRGEPVHVARDGEKLIEVARDVETTVIQVPAGIQDYYGAMFGGLQVLRWGAGGHRREWLPDSVLEELGQKLILFYSGQSRNSGINNWALFKSFIDNREDVRAKFTRINEATQRLERALQQQDWTEVSAAIADEWKTRRTLAVGITTPEIDQAYEFAAKQAPIAGKVCGAGGGGCFFIYVASAGSPEGSQLKPRIEQGIAQSGATVRRLPFKPVRRGLEVSFGSGS